MFKNYNMSFLEFARFSVLTKLLLHEALVVDLALHLRFLKFFQTFLKVIQDRLETLIFSLKMENLCRIIF